MGNSKSVANKRKKTLYQNQISKELLPFEDYIKHQLCDWLITQFQIWSTLNPTKIELESDQNFCANNDIHKFDAQFRKQLYKIFQEIHQNYPNKVTDFQKIRGFNNDDAQQKDKNDQGTKKFYKKLFIIYNLCKILNLDFEDIVQYISKEIKIKFFVNLIQVIYNKYLSKNGTNQNKFIENKSVSQYNKVLKEEISQHPKQTIKKDINATKENIVKILEGLIEHSKEDNIESSPNSKFRKSQLNTKHESLENIQIKQSKKLVKLK